MNDPGYSGNEHDAAQRKVNGMLDEIRLRNSNGLSKDGTLEKVVSCFAGIRELGALALVGPFDENRTVRRRGLFAAMFALINQVPIDMPLRVQMIHQALDWMGGLAKEDFEAMRQRVLLYHWLKRQGLGMRPPSHFRNFDSSPNGRPQPSIVSDDEVDSFAKNHLDLIYKALANEIYPPNNVYFDDPLVAPGDLEFYATYKQLDDLAAGAKLFADSPKLLGREKRSPGPASD